MGTTLVLAAQLVAAAGAWSVGPDGFCGPDLLRPGLAARAHSPEGSSAEERVPADNRVGKIFSPSDVQCAARFSARSAGGPMCCWSAVSHLGGAALRDRATPSTDLRQRTWFGDTRAPEESVIGRALAVGPDD
ncbi:hypothetical protein NDU88_003047 [Pleurodeles waltl]|uniref:Secreted protein n=1 Tax=Pleurodeles waltl TaxID=8319 RepID=A0AAV7T442_PLEWA|nr:hypothetical protein NDU88_003047 [Pleurodeles waltl]